MRIATVDDVPALVALVESAYRGDSSRTGWTTEADLLDGQRTDADEVTAAVADPDGVLLVEPGDAGDAGAADQGLLGCCRLERHGDAAYFGMFAVSPAAQGSGLGGRLLAEAEARATGWGVTHVEMTVIVQRPDLIAWYERRGYARTGETRPFPYGDSRFGLPKVPDLAFAVLVKPVH